VANCLRKMRTNTIDHAGIGTFETTPLIDKLIADVLRSGRISYGPMSREFEERFAAEHNCEYAILSNSGTSSLQVALQAMRDHLHWSPGDNVIVPATTFVATPNIVVHNNMRPRFVDVRKDDYGMDPALIEAAIDSRTRAIIPVHLFGQPCDMDPIREIAAAHQLRIIEDSCETMFAKYKGEMVGSMGDVGAFSLYMAHILVAGVGGVGTTNDPELAARMRSLVNHGLSLRNLNAGKNFAPQFMLGRNFEFEGHGHSFRITELEAALALGQMDDPYYNILAPRRRNARHLSTGIKNANTFTDTGDEWLTTSTPIADRTHAWMMFPVMVTDAAPFKKMDITTYLNEQGIETRDMLPILGQPAYSYLDPSDFPVSADIIEKGFYIGCHQGLTPDHVSYMVQHIERFYNGYQTN